MIAHRGHRVVVLTHLEKSTDLSHADLTHANWLGTDLQTDALETRNALTEKVDWLVVDHYALDSRWEKPLRPHCKNLMVLDDLADRPHDCDVLLDQNLGRSAQDYCGLLKPDTATLIGPRYALLRPEFAQLRSQSLARRALPQIKHLLITMGGVDKDNATGQVLHALTSCHLPDDLRITVVMGPNAPHLADVQQQAAQTRCPTQVLVSVSDIAQLMVDSDWCIGAAGGTSWERCCLGLPTLLLVLADNQLSGARALAQSGAALPLTTTQDMAQVFAKFLSGSAMSQLKSLSQAAAAISDGHGAHRIVDKMFSERLYA